jgi:hypothetical protein
VKIGYAAGREGDMRLASWVGLIVGAAGCAAWGAGAPSLEASGSAGPRLVMSLNTRDLLAELVGPDVVMDAVVYGAVPPALAENISATRAFTTVHYVAPFRQGDAERAFVVLSTSAEGNDCHACAVRIGFASLTRVPASDGATGWRVDHVQVDWGSVGAYGIPPRYELEQVGPQRFALRAEIGDMHQGYMWGMAWWIVEGSGGFSQAASLETYANNEGMCAPDGAPCYENEAMSRFEPGASPDVWDLVVKRKGTTESESGVQPVLPLERWAWDPKAQVWAAPKAPGR